MPGEYDPTLPGRLFDALRDDYPAKPEVQSAFQADIQVGPAAVGPIHLTHGLGKVLLRDNDRTHLIGIGNGVLSVHALRPYRGWDEDFRPRVEQALAAYERLDSGRLVTRVGVRYINLIGGKGSWAAATGVVRAAPAPASPGQYEPSTFYYRNEYISPDRSTKLLITLARAASGDRPDLLLDLDVVKDQFDPLPALLATMPIIDDVRLRERDVFEDIITDEARHLFDA